MDLSSLKQYRDTVHDELFGSVMPFWTKYGPDAQYGGFKTCLDRTGQAYSKEKSVWMQGRAGWMFGHLYNRYGTNDEWLSIAGDCIDFSNKYCIDPADERMYFVVGDDGTPFRKRRYTFSEIFYVMANAEYFAATGSEKHREDARRCFRMIKGIHDDPSSDPYKITPKFLPTAPAMRGLSGTMMLMLTARTLRVCDPENADEYRAAERQLLDEALTFHFNKDLGVLLEGVGPKGEYVSDYSSGRVVIPGHCLEAAWYYLREAEELGDDSIVEKIETFYDGAYRMGWDQEYGGLLYFVDSEGHPPQAYEYDMKLWWIHAEAISSAIRLYRYTGKDRYWQDFKRIFDYSFEHFKDKEYDEWYGYLRRDGQPTMPACKGNVFKGPFHVPRMLCETLDELDKIIDANQ
ncbi:MAG: AGE family epimerase/isomerase [Saccharofermentanales bacterium]